MLTSALYVNKRKAKTFYQSAGLQLPLEGKRFFDLFGSSIKTEEDLVKFKLQKEEEYKAAVAREAANEKDSSLQTQPAEQQSPPSSPIQNRINYFEKNFTVTLDKEPILEKLLCDIAYHGIIYRRRVQLFLEAMGTPLRAPPERRLA